MTDPRRNHRDWQPLKMHQRRARMPRRMQLDMTYPRGLQRVTPVPRQHLGRIRLASLVAAQVSKAPPPIASRSAACRALATFSSDTSRSSSGSVRRDLADFGSFSTVGPPADTRLLTMLRVWP